MNILRFSSAVIILLLSVDVFAQSVNINVNVLGLNTNQSQTNTALDSLCGALSQGGGTASQNDLSQTCNALAGINLNDPNLATALDILIPEETFAIGDSLIYATDIQISNIYSRIDTIRINQIDSGRTRQGTDDNNSSGGGGAAAELVGGIEFFVSGSVSTGEFDGNQLQADADTLSGSFTIGIDNRLGNNTIIGGGVGLFTHNTDFTNTAGELEVDGFNLALFLTRNFERFGYFDAVMDIGANSYDISRQISLEGEPRVLASGSTDSTTLSLTGTYGKYFNINSLDIGPYARASITSASVDGYTETASSQSAGFGSALDISSQSIRSTKLALGGSISAAISRTSAVFVPRAALELELEADTNRDELSAVFLADPDQTVFVIDGEDRDSSYLNLALGGSAVFAGGGSAYVFYETRLAHTEITQHWLKAGLRFEF